MDVQEVEASAKELFMQGGEGYTRLLETWEHIPAAQHQHYPETAFQTAKIYIGANEIYKARYNLQICSQVWQDEPEKQSRILLMLAQLCYQETDFEGVQRFISEIRAVTSNAHHLAECNFLLGEITRSSEPEQAFKHYDHARKQLLRLKEMGSPVDFDLARYSLRLAETAFYLNMPVAGWHYQNYAEQAARNTGHPDLINAVLLRSGKAYEQEGSYDLALDKYDECEITSTNVAQQAEISNHRAHIALTIYDDKTATNELTKPFPVGYLYVHCQRLLLQGWLAALAYDLSTATHKLTEARLMTGDDRTLLYLAYRLEGFIAAQEGLATREVIEHLLEAIEFFSSRKLYQMASQTRLILAWLYALEGTTQGVGFIFQAMENDLRMVKSVGHLTRLYELSIAALGHWWKPELKERLRSDITKRRKGRFSQIRVYGLGVPTAYVDGKEIPQREGYRNIGLRMLLYLLEKRQANLEEIIDALYPSGNPSVSQKRFHNMMSSLKSTLGERAWYVYLPEYQLYQLSQNAISYYDGDEYKAIYQLFLKTSHQPHSFSLAIQLLNRYDTFAKTFEGEVFEELRHFYTACHDLVLYQIQDKLPDILSEQLISQAIAKQLTYYVKTRLS